MTDAPINADDLSAYVDGRLAADRTAAVEAYLSQHEAAAAQVAADLALRAGLRAALTPVAAGPMPPELHLATRIADRQARPRRWARAAALAVACITLGASAGWMARGMTAPPTAGVAALGREAAYSYRTYASDASTPSELASSDRTRLARWISGPLRRPISLPDLARAGFYPTRGKLVATPHGPAGFFTYRNRDGVEIAVFVRPMHMELDAAPIRQSFPGVASFAWADRGLGYGIVGDEASSQLRPVVEEMLRQARVTPEHL